MPPRLGSGGFHYIMVQQMHLSASNASVPLYNASTDASGRLLRPATLFSAREWRLTKNAGAPVWSIQSCANGPRILAHAGRGCAAWRGARILDLGMVCPARGAARGGGCGAKRQCSFGRRNFRHGAAQPGGRTHRNCDQAARRRGRLGRPARPRGGATRGEADSGGARGRGYRPRRPPGRSPCGSRHPGARRRARNARMAGEERICPSACASRSIRRPARRTIRCSTSCTNRCPASRTTGCLTSRTIRWSTNRK